MDDGSTDGSSDIALRYAHKYPGKICYHEHEEHANKGLSSSRNHGIKNSEGEFIAFLDADDVWLENKLITQVSIFQRNPQVGMVAEASLYWYEWAKKMRHNMEVPIGADPELIYEPHELILSLYPLGKGAAPVPSGLMITKEALERSGMFEESFVKEYALYEDQAFLSKMYLNEKIYISSACNNLYRQRPGSIVTWVKETGKYHSVREYFLRWLKAYLDTHKIESKRLNKHLNRAMYRYNYPKLFYVTHDIPRDVWKGFKKIIPGEIKDFMKWKVLKLKKEG
ncbi:MAG: glycosyltransferase family 2 protein [Bacteroidota bacterium]|nr:glycosyltransferase family 2 protein [Bacteroidota bacterium]